MSEKKYTYRTGGYPDVIKRLEVVKETEKQVVVLVPDLWSGKPRTSRNAKRSDYHNFFDTFEQAKAFLMAQCDSQIRVYQSNIDSVKARKAKYNELREQTNDP
jgi:hypothetical protein